MLWEVDSPIVETYRTMLAAKVAEQSNAVAARNAAKNGAKAPKWKSLLTKPAEPNTQEYVTNTLLDIADLTISKDNAHDAAHIAAKLYKLADHFAEQASLWATDLPSDHGPSLSDDEIKKLTETCDMLFGKFMDEVIPLAERRNDPSIESLVVSVVGQPVLAKKQTDGTVRYQLDLERIRTPRNGSSSSNRLHLTVNGTPMEGENFAQEVDVAFSLKASTFLDLLKDQMAGTGKYNTKGEPMPFAHNSKTYTVQLHTVQS